MRKRRYPGISPFTSEQKDVFFGREDDINKLYKLILLRKQILIYSKSGVGKTSLLNAGVLPKLKEEFEIINVRFFAYDNNKSSSPIKSILQKVNDLLSSDYSGINTYLDQLLEDSNSEKTLWYYFKQIQFLNQQSKKIIIVFDQFEELFTYPEDQINQFKEQIYELTKTSIPDNIISIIADKKEVVKNDDAEILYDDLNIKVVFAIRSDHLSFLNELTDKLNDIQEVFYELKPLSEKQARHAIIMPSKEISDFETPSFEYDSKALIKILDSLSNYGSQNIETTQLQIVCQKIENIALYKLSSQSENEQLTIYEKDLPKFEDIFLSFYKDSIEKISITKQKEEQIKARVFIENQLIRNEQRISLDEIICLDYVSIITLKTLVNTHLLRAEQNSTGGLSYELSHDSLIAAVKLAKQEREKEELYQIEKSKQNKSYLISNILLAPLIILMLATILRYKGSYQYVFKDNINIPFYLFSIAIIVQFLGLAAGSEEMVRERRHNLKKGNLKVNDINKKIGMLVLFSAIQVLFLVVIGNWVLKIKGMDFFYWLILFSSAITGNITGLFISTFIKEQALVNSFVVLLLVPQILYSGFLISYQDINQAFSSEETTPLYGDLMPARWAYEALAVKQAKDNKWDKMFYYYDRIRSSSNYYKNFWRFELQNYVKFCIENDGNKLHQVEFRKKMDVISNEFERMGKVYGLNSNLVEDLRAYKFDPEIQQKCYDFISEVKTFFTNEYIFNDNKKNLIIDEQVRTNPKYYLEEREKYHNDKLEEIVINKGVSIAIKISSDNKLYNNYDFIFSTSESKNGKAQLYSPDKRIGNLLLDTFWFNLIVIWLMSIIMYIVLILSIRYNKRYLFGFF